MAREIEVLDDSCKDIGCKLQKQQKDIYFCSKVCTEDNGLLFMKFRSAKDRTCVYVYL